MAYMVYVIPQAWQEMKVLPGNMRQRIRRLIDALPNEPIPQRSKELRITADGVVLYRLRLDRWRLIYAIDQNLQLIQVLAIRKRPPYNYDDLDALLQQLH